jgi:hypothetical protein
MKRKRKQEKAQSEPVVTTSEKAANEDLARSLRHRMEIFREQAEEVPHLRAKLTRITGQMNEFMREVDRLFLELAVTRRVLEGVRDGRVHIDDIDEVLNQGPSEQLDLIE